MSKTNSMARQKLLLVAGLVLIFGYAAWQIGMPLRTTRIEPVILETNHLAVLAPHRHGPNDSVTDTWHHETLAARQVLAPRDMYVTGIHFNFENAPTSTIHHMSLTDVSRRNETCPNYPTGAELFSFSADRLYENEIRFPEGYALRIPKGTPLSMYIMVHNPEPPIGPGGTYRDVYTRVQLIESDQGPATLKLVHPYLLHLDDVPCSYGKADGSEGVIFTLPARTMGYHFSGKGQSDPAASKLFTRPATLINLTGHLHEHQDAKELIVRKNDQILYVFRPTPVTNDPYFSPLYRASSTFHVEAGDRVWLTAVYDNPSSVPIHGAMGAAGFYYTEE